MEINGGYLEWPLEVYGLVATRDSMDHNRNIIFRLRRDACQLLTQQVWCRVLKDYFFIYVGSAVLSCVLISLLQLIDMLMSSATDACRIHFWH